VIPAGRDGGLPVEELPLPASRPTALPHLPALDGLRALAVVGVLLYHAGVPWARGGFLGVDLFFVLSGFLITTLLLREHAWSGRIDLIAFWGRRARRLYPALLLVLVTVVLWAALTASSAQRGALRGDGIAALFYVANWHFVAANQGYFAQYADPSPLLHTWSLGIEEQFYLGWPLLVVALLRLRRDGRWLMQAALAMAAGSALWMALAYRPGTDPSRVYYGTDTRAHTILIGVAFALLLRAETGGAGARPTATRRRRAGLSALLAVAALLAAMVLISDHLTALYRGGFAAYALLAGLLIAGVVVAPRCVVARALSTAPLVWLGRVSYGVYLWHWPVYLALNGARTGLSGYPLLVMRLAVTLAIASASYLLLERPLLRGRLRGLRARVALPGAVATASVVLVACTSTVSSPVTARSTRAASSGGLAEPPSPPASTSPRRTVSGARAHRAGRLPLRVTFLGDSVALTLAQGLPETKAVKPVNRAILGCGITTLSPYRYFGAVRTFGRRCGRWPQTWAADVRRTRPDVVVVLVGRWEVMDQQLRGRWRHVGDPDLDSYLTGAFGTALTAAKASGASVVFLTAPYYHRGERPDGGRWPEDDPTRVDTFNRLLRAFVAAHRGQATVLEFGDRLAGGGSQYVESVNGLRLRYDGVHLTPGGARWVGRWLYPQLVRVASAR
jgi:peptidoglycan/LPS O-acetylase OafA/YrhL